VTELEILVLDWIAKALHLSPAFLSTSEVGGGIILGSASEVAVTVMVAARERALAMLSDAKGAEVPADGGARPEATVQETGTQDKDLDDEEQWGKWRGDATGRLVAYGTTQVRADTAPVAALYADLQLADAQHRLKGMSHSRPGVPCPGSEGRRWLCTARRRVAQCARRGHGEGSCAIHAQ